MRKLIEQSSPHGRAIGLELRELGPRHALLLLPWREDLVGNPANGVLHGGVITTLMDQACGAAALCALPEPMPLATLDLRIDYLRPATPRVDLYCRAECYRLTRTIAFLRGTAYHQTPEDAVAQAAGAFMLTGT